MVDSIIFHLLTLGISEKNLGAFRGSWHSQGIAFRILPPAGHLVVERITPGTPAEALHLPKVQSRDWAKSWPCNKIIDIDSLLVLLDLLDLL